jgi:hypothetical protein
MKLKEIFNLMEQPYVHDRKTPCDIEEFLDYEYYSSSKKKYVKYSDMDLTHFIRAILKSSNQVELNNELTIANNTIAKLNRKIAKLTRIMEE